MQTKFKQIETLWWLEDKFLEDPSFHQLFINISVEEKIMKTFTEMEISYYFSIESDK